MNFSDLMPDCNSWGRIFGGGEKLVGEELHMGNWFDTLTNLSRSVPESFPPNVTISGRGAFTDEKRLFDAFDDDSLSPNIPLELMYTLGSGADMEDFIDNHLNIFLETPLEFEAEKSMSFKEVEDAYREMPTNSKIALARSLIDRQQGFIDQRTTRKLEDLKTRNVGQAIILKREGSFELVLEKKEGSLVLVEKEKAQVVVSETKKRKHDEATPAAKKQKGTQGLPAPAPKEVGLKESELPAYKEMLVQAVDQLMEQHMADILEKKAGDKQVGGTRKIAREYKITLETKDKNIEIVLKVDAVTKNKRNQPGPTQATLLGTDAEEATYRVQKRVGGKKEVLVLRGKLSVGLQYKE